MSLKYFNGGVNFAGTIHRNRDLCEKLGIDPNNFKYDLGSKFFGNYREPELPTVSTPMEIIPPSIQSTGQQSQQLIKDRKKMEEYQKKLEEYQKKRDTIFKKLDDIKQVLLSVDPVISDHPCLTFSFPDFDLYTWNILNRYDIDALRICLKSFSGIGAFNQELSQEIRNFIEDIAKEVYAYGKISNYNLLKNLLSTIKKEKPFVICLQECPDYLSEILELLKGEFSFDYQQSLDDKVRIPGSKNRYKNERRITIYSSEVQLLKSYSYPIYVEDEAPTIRKLFFSEQFFKDLTMDPNDPNYLTDRIPFTQQNLRQLQQNSRISKQLFKKQQFSRLQMQGSAPMQVQTQGQVTSAPMQVQIHEQPTVDDRSFKNVLICKFVINRQTIYILNLHVNFATRIKYYNKFLEMLSRLQQAGKKFIAVGDFNRDIKYCFDKYFQEHPELQVIGCNEFLGTFFHKMGPFIHDPKNDFEVEKVCSNICKMYVETNLTDFIITNMSLYSESDVYRLPKRIKQQQQSQQQI